MTKEQLVELLKKEAAQCNESADDVRNRDVIRDAFQVCAIVLARIALAAEDSSE